MVMYLADLGLLISLLLGVTAIFRPNMIASLVCITPISVEGSAEVRATYGGFFAGISTYGLISGETLVYVTLGVGWLSASVVRFVACFANEYSVKNVQGTLFELVVGILCLSKLLY